MIPGLKEYIDAKCDVFRNYMIVPEDRQAEFEQLEADMMSLGENCFDFNDYEAKFAAKGLSDRYNSLLMSCQAKPADFTQEQKQQMTHDAIKAATDPKTMAQSAGESLVTELKSAAITLNRRRMIEDGTMDDYTRASNALDSAKSVGSFLARKFKK